MKTYEINQIGNLCSLSPGVYLSVTIKFQTRSAQKTAQDEALKPLILHSNRGVNFEGLLSNLTSKCVGCFVDNSGSKTCAGLLCLLQFLLFTRFHNLEQSRNKGVLQRWMAIRKALQVLERWKSGEKKRQRKRKKLTESITNEIVTKRKSAFVLAGTVRHVWRTKEKKK